MKHREGVGGVTGHSGNGMVSTMLEIVTVKLLIEGTDLKVDPNRENSKERPQTRNLAGYFKQDTLLVLRIEIFTLF